MKRYLWIAAFVFVLIGCLCTAVYADVETVSYTVGSGVMNISISGTAEAPGEAISLEVLKDGVTAAAFNAATNTARIGMIDYARETAADANGMWSFNIQLKDAQANQRLFRVRTKNGKITVLPVYGAADAVKAINSAGAEKMGAVLEEYTPFLGYKSSYAYTDVFALFRDEKKQYVYSRLGARSNFANVDEIDAAFEEYTAMALIAKALGTDELQKDLPACAKILNQDMRSYNSLSSSQKLSVCMGLLDAFENAVFSKTQLQTKLSQLISDAQKSVNSKPTTTGGSGGGSGGNRGGSGGGSYAGSMQYEAPADVALLNQTTYRPFSDLDSVEWARESIETLASQGVINGKEEGVFAPNDLITREEFVKMTVEAFGVADMNAECDFADVVEDEWYYHYVGAALQSGLVNGMGDGTFGIGMPITRQDMATLLWNGVGSRITAQAGAEFADEDEISDYAKQAVHMLRGVGIIDGIGENIFLPARNATRAEAAKLLYLTIQVIK